MLRSEANTGPALSSSPLHPSSSSPSSSNSSTLSSATDAKPVVVRVKRKRSQLPLPAFWLKINERPVKRVLHDFSQLSVSDSGTREDEVKTKKLLLQHLDTIHDLEAVEDILPSVMGKRHKMKARNIMLKQTSQKKNQLLSAARQEHEDMVKTARFEQIWKSRKQNNDWENSCREVCQLYDVIQVDPKDGKAEKSGKLKEYEEDTLLYNYLPLLKEYLPTSSGEIKYDASSHSSEDEYVYDLYTGGVGNDLGKEIEELLEDYPLVQVEDRGDDLYDDSFESEHDSCDSNAEDNPLNDYPDEESEGEESEEDIFKEIEGSDSQNEIEDSEEDEDEDDENDEWRY